MSFAPPPALEATALKSMGLLGVPGLAVRKAGDVDGLGGLMRGDGDDSRAASPHAAASARCDKTREPRRGGGAVSAGSRLKSGYAVEGCTCSELAHAEARRDISRQAFWHPI